MNHIWFSGQLCKRLKYRLFRIYVLFSCIIIQLSCNEHRQHSQNISLEVGDTLMFHNVHRHYTSRIYFLNYIQLSSKQTKHNEYFTCIDCKYYFNNTHWDHISDQFHRNNYCHQLHKHLDMILCHQLLNHSTVNQYKVYPHKDNCYLRYCILVSISLKKSHSRYQSHIPLNQHHIYNQLSKLYYMLMQQQYKYGQPD